MLLKSVLSSFPTYFLSLFTIPNSVAIMWRDYKETFCRLPWIRSLSSLRWHETLLVLPLI